MELALKHNFAATMFTMGCFAMTIHADAVRKLDGSPTVVLVGPAGRGKTTALQLAMACAGQLLEQVYHQLKSDLIIPLAGSKISYHTQMKLLRMRVITECSFRKRNRIERNPVPGQVAPDKIYGGAAS